MALENRLNDPNLLKSFELSISNSGKSVDTNNKDKKEIPTKKHTHANSDVGSRPIKKFKSTKPLEIWGKVLIEIKKLGKMIIYTNLFDTKLITIDDSLLGIVFDKDSSSFNRMFIAKIENLEIIETVVNNLLVQNVKLKCLTENDVIKNSESASSSIHNEKSDELVEKATDIALKLNVPLNIIDE